MGDADRHRLRATFDEVADLYEAARPTYPPQLFDDLVSLAGLSPGARVVEIGCGTGQATLPLAERGLEIVCVLLQLDGALFDAIAKQLPKLLLVQRDAGPLDFPQQPTNPVRIEPIR